jgi:hypothetical protein
MSEPVIDVRPNSAPVPDCEFRSAINKRVYESLFGSGSGHAGLHPELSSGTQRTKSQLFLSRGSLDLQAFLDDPQWAARVMTGLVALTYLPSRVSGESLLPAKSDVVDVKNVKVTNEALSFCARNKIVPYLEQAIGLVRMSFSPDRQMSVSLGSDPDESDEFAILEVDASGDFDADMRSYSMFADEWSATVEWPTSRMILLDLRTRAH